jgi:hypothetical protein
MLVARKRIIRGSSAKAIEGTSCRVNSDIQSYRTLTKNAKKGNSYECIVQLDDLKSTKEDSSSWRQARESRNASEHTLNPFCFDTESGWPRGQRLVDVLSERKSDEG